MKRNRRCIVGFLLFSVVCLVLMSFKEDRRNSLISKNLEIFHAVFRELDMMYVDTVDADKVIESAIHGMVSNLDPYTVFYPED